MRQAVLGATGNIGSLLVNELLERNIEVSAMSRSLSDGARIDGVEYTAVDAEKSRELLEATQVISVLYVTLSIPYNTESWEHSWPVVMRNIIAAAQANKFKVIFLDNVYMYGQVDGRMTEDSPIKPASKKGEVRAEIARMLQDAMQSDGVTGVIARSADFYGPHTRISDAFFQGAFSDGVAKWMGNPDVMRAWSYTLDNAKALAILGNDERANGQVWHIPAAEAMTGREFISLAGSILGKELGVVTVPAPGAKAREAFAQQAPEIADMMYQYDHPYVFDSTRFQETFGMQPTSYEKGFKHVFDTLLLT